MRLLFFSLLAMIALSGTTSQGATLDGSLVNLVVCKSPGKAASGSADVAFMAGGKKTASAGKAVRTLRVYENKSGAEGCLATYSKTNVEKTVGSSRQTKQCQSILEGIRKNLESSNWSCKQAMDPSVVKSTVAAVSDTSVDSSANEPDDLEKELNRPDATTVR